MEYTKERCYLEVTVLRMSLNHAKRSCQSRMFAAFQHLAALPEGEGQGEFLMRITFLWNQSGGYKYCQSHIEPCLIIPTKEQWNLIIFWF